MAQENDADEGEAEYAGRLELCQRVGVPPVETILRERRVAWMAHALRNKKEACHYLAREEVRKGTPWGRLIRDDFDEVGLPIDQFLDLEAPPAARAIKAHLVAKRPTKPLPKQRRGDRRGKTEKCREKTNKQRENIQQQKAEAELRQANFIASISGRRWERFPSAAGNYWQTKEEAVNSPPVQFEIESEDFCEGSGREEYRVCGVWFQKMSNGTYVARR
ncbi:unnamed protein product [Amoebophrya sp. A120]|nr:unnamed protein product [Amoebophrya sp. A120]|eukprot:GSA120T00014534001.1